jgi:type I restriction enzyme M protein
MSSQASSAGRDEAKVRQKLVETGDVDIMIAVRSNFFYTRTVPCELWFFNRNKPEAHRDKVLMLDARNIYRKVTRKIYDFSPEQLQNLLAIIWLYRGQSDRFLDLVAHYLDETLEEAGACFETEDRDGKVIHPLADYQAALAELRQVMQPFLDGLPADAAHAEAIRQLEEGCKTFDEDGDAFLDAAVVEAIQWARETEDHPLASPLCQRGVGGNTVHLRSPIFMRKPVGVIPAKAGIHSLEPFLDPGLRRGDDVGQRGLYEVNGIGVGGDFLHNQAVKTLAPLAETSRDLVRQADLIYKLACRLIDVCESELRARENDLWVNREIARARKTADEARQIAVEQLKQVRTFHKQAAWLTERFPDAVLRDVEGLVKLVDRSELEANDWSLTPGRYVGVAPEEEDDGFDFEEALRDIHIELEDLNAEALELAAKINKNFQELGV